jgi:hypothetical protein
MYNLWNGRGTFFRILGESAISGRSRNLNPLLGPLFQERGEFIEEGAVDKLVYDGELFPGRGQNFLDFPMLGNFYHLGIRS